MAVVAEEVGTAEVAEVDALDEQAVQAHLRYLVGRAGRVHISVNAIGIPNRGILGVPLAAAKEALTRDLSAELAPHGIRVVGLRPRGMPETRTIRDAYEPLARAAGITWDRWLEFLASRTHPRRLMRLDELADVAVFVASAWMTSVRCGRPT